MHKGVSTAIAFLILGGAGVVDVAAASKEKGFPSGAHFSILI